MELSSGTVKYQAAGMLASRGKVAADELSDVAMRVWEATDAPVRQIVAAINRLPMVLVRARKLKVGEVVAQPWHRTVTAPPVVRAGRLFLDLDHETVEVSTGKMVARFVTYGEVIGRVSGR